MSRTPDKDNQPAAGGSFDPEVKGVDARRRAERVAEEAGRKAREKSAADGKPTEEVGGPEGLEPTRYGDWEKAGRCVDF